MKRLAPLLLLVCLLPSGLAAAWEGEGTLLDLSSLPEDWEVIWEYWAPVRDLNAFSERWGVNAVWLRDYFLGGPPGTIWVKLAVLETEAEAQALYDLYLDLHTPDEVSIRGRRVLEVVTEYPELIPVARASLKFQCEPMEMEDKSAVRDYLAAWSWPVKSWADLTDRLGAELDQYRVFLVGESHGSAFNQQLESALVEFFVREGGVGSLLLELPPSVVGFLREYVQTGDEALLQLVFSSVQGTYFCTQDNYAHWQRMRALWQSLPQEKKFRLIGLDVEHHSILALRYLQYLLDKVASSSLSQTKLAQIGAVLRGELRVANTEVVPFVSGLLQELEREVVQAELGELVNEFELVLTSLLASFQLTTLGDSQEWNAQRDRAMYENFMKQAVNGSGEKFFGQWGLNHVFQKEQMGVTWLATAIDQTDEFSGRVFSMVLVYHDSYYLERETNRPRHFGNYAWRAYLLAELAAGEPLLVKLDGAGSPFDQALEWKLSVVEPTQGVTTDYFQYILFIPGAKASTPWAAAP